MLKQSGLQLAYRDHVRPYVVAMLPMHRRRDSR